MPPPPSDPDFPAVVAEQFEAVRDALAAWAGWRTRRVCPPVAVLGDRHGVQLGVRQQRRKAPIETTQVAGVCVPTAEETLRIKAWMVADRGATRDYVDVAALADLLGAERAAAALVPLSHLYAPVGTETAAMRFAQAAMRAPVDAAEVDLRDYRGLRPPYDDMEYVRGRVRDTALRVLERELAAAGDDTYA